MQTTFYALGSLFFLAMTGAAVLLYRSLSQLNQFLRSGVTALNATLADLSDASKEMTRTAQKLSSVSEGVPAALKSCEQAADETRKVVSRLEPVAANLDDITTNIKDIIERVRTGQDSGKNNVVSSLLSVFTRR